MNRTPTVGIAAALALALSTTVTHAAVKTGTDRGETIRGTNRADTIDARGGNDKVQGLGGNDRLKGGFGNDVVNGGPGNDVCKGNEGNDTFSGGLGHDWLIGGQGVDLVDYSDLGTPDRNGYGLRHASLGPVPEAAEAASVGRVDAGILGFDRVVGIEDLIGSKFKDRIFGSIGPNRLRAGAGEDRLDGQGGLDILSGGTEADAFVFYYQNPFHPAGRATITDFTRGQDRFSVYVSTDPTAILSFSDIDTDGDGRLDAPDTYVRIAPVGVGGKFKTSTILDFTNLVGEAHTLTFYGVVGLTASDFES